MWDRRMTRCFMATFENKVYNITSFDTLNEVDRKPSATSSTSVNTSVNIDEERKIAQLTEPAVYTNQKSRLTS